MRAKLFRALRSSLAIAAMLAASTLAWAAEPHHFEISGQLIHNRDSKITVTLVDKDGKVARKTLAASLSLTDFKGTRTFDVGVVNGKGEVTVRIADLESQLAHVEEKTDADRKLTGDTILSVKSDAEVKP